MLDLMGIARTHSISTCHSLCLLVLLLLLCLFFFFRERLASLFGLCISILYVCFLGALDKLCLRTFKCQGQLVSHLDLFIEFVEVAIDPDIADASREHVVKSIESLSSTPFSWYSCH